MDKALYLLAIIAGVIGAMFVIFGLASALTAPSFQYGGIGSLPIPRGGIDMLSLSTGITLLVSAIVFGAFGRVVELLEKIATNSGATATEAPTIERPAHDAYKVVPVDRSELEAKVASMKGRREPV